MGSGEPVQGVVAVIEREGRLLVIRRAEGVAAPGHWCLPGGAIEAGETAAQAVVREVREELGLVVDAEGELWRWQRPDGRLVLSWWRVRLREPGAACRLDAAEVAEARWVRPADFRQMTPVLQSNLEFLAHYLAE